MLPFQRYRAMLPVWVRALLFVLIVPGSAAVLLPYLLLRAAGDLGRMGLGGWRSAGFPVALLGLVTYVPCVREFVVRGRGTPSFFDPPRKLVGGGLYRYVRNPMYVTFGAILVGEALLLDSAVLLGYVLVCGLAAHLFIIFYEEPTLRSSFGENYVSYCRRVPRWIPRVPAARQRSGATRR